LQVSHPTIATAVGAALEPRPLVSVEPAVFLTVQRFCHDRSLPRSSFYKELKAGRLKAVKRGRRTLVHQDEAKRYDATLLNAA
jgi:hypothetical protein